MSNRIAALAVGAIAIALVVAQDIAPRTPLYHTWQYALALSIALAVVLAYANGVRRGDDGGVGKRSLVACAGAVITIVAGLAAGVLGPDTAVVTGTPGTVTPIPALGAAAFFAQADPSTIARGDAGITLRRKDRSSLDVGDRGRPFGESLLYREPRPAAFVEAWDSRGAHLTITQPTNASFLSPVLLFGLQQRIGAFDVPYDSFATPAQHRMFHALYYTPKDLAALPRAVPDVTHPAVILYASDDRGGQLGITFVQSGQDVTLAGVRVRVTIGTYPALAIASAPPLWTLVAGIALFIAGLAWAASGSGSWRLRSGHGRGALVHPE
jgi:hypothetical protein